MRDFELVCQGTFACVLFACGALFSGTATWKCLRWMLDGPSPRLGWFETLFPVRGRWLRYLLTPPLLLATWMAIWFTAFMLWSVPAPMGLVVFVAWGTNAAVRKLHSNRRPDHCAFPSPGDRCGTGSCDVDR